VDSTVEEGSETNNDDEESSPTEKPSDAAPTLSIHVSYDERARRCVLH